MAVSRRAFTFGSLLAAGTLGMPVFAKAQAGKTVALLFDSLVSPFWVSGLEITKQKGRSRGPCIRGCGGRRFPNPPRLA